MKKTQFLIAALSCLAAGAVNVHAGTIAQWGVAGGDANIVTASQAYSSVPTTYASGTAINPAVGVNYYNAYSGRTPIFNGAFSISPGTSMQVLNAGSGRDQFQAASGTSAGTDFSGMFTWESANFLAGYTGDLLTLSAEAYRFGTTSAGTLQFIFQANDNSWYVSSTTFSLATSFPGTPQTIANVGAESWLNFTPVSGGAATIGSAASISDFSNVKAVGIYFDITKTASLNGGVSSDFFQATAAAPVPEPSTLALLGGGMMGLLVCRRRR